MTDKATVPATQFSRNFAHYQDEAIRTKVIVVTSHDRVVGGFLSAEEFAHYQELKRREREVLRVGDLADDVVADIQAAEYDAPAR
jgi:PHD/YefM family antitoxin component YafN of YafNO toxin-antitoxin module